jgi:hypothetical protein
VGACSQGRMLTRTLLLVAILGTTGACDSSSGTDQVAGPDCPAQLRFHGAPYTAYRRRRFTHELPSRLGTATPVCMGTKIVAGGPVAIWAFPGWSSSEVIGRQVYPRPFVVYVADSVRPSQRTHVLAAIASSR